MPKRGLARLLLLFFRAQLTRTRIVGAVIAALAALVAVVPRGDDGDCRAGALTKLMQSGAWEHALAEDSDRTAWPWGDTLAERSSVVPRLGLSAAVLKAPGEDSEVSLPLQSSRLPNVAAKADAGEAKRDLGDLAIGDPSAVAAENALNRNPQARGLASGQTSRIGGVIANNVTTISGKPIDPLVARVLSLLFEAVHADQTPPSVKNPEQKL